MKNVIQFQRRKTLLYGGSLGLTTLAGCGAMPAQPGEPAPGQSGNGARPISSANQGQPTEPPFQRRGDRARAQSRRIFGQLDRSEPITPESTNSRYSALDPETQQAYKEYVLVKDQLLAALPPGIPMRYEDAVWKLAPAVARFIKALLLDAARADKRLAEGQSGAHKSQPPFRVSPGAIQVRVPHGHMLSYVQSGFCMDPGLPAPGQDDAFEMRHISERVPPELVPLMQGIGQWSHQTGNSSGAQGLTWAIMGAGTKSHWANHLSPKALAQLDEALPGGAKTFAEYHNKKLKEAANDAFAQKLMEAVFKQSGLDRILDPRLLLDNSKREEAVNDLMRDLIGRRDSVERIKGAGYSMLAPGVAARATGVGTLKPGVQIVNVSGHDFLFEILDWFAQPLAKLQATSPTSDVSAMTGKPVPVAGPATADSLRTEAYKNVLGDAFKDVLKWRLGWALENAPGATQAISKGVTVAAQVVGLSRSARTAMLQLVSGVLSATPIVGTLLSSYEFISGKDWMTGENLSAAERALSLLGTVPGANVLRSVASLSDASKFSGVLVRAADNSSFFKFIDKTGRFKTWNDFIWGDTGRNLANMLDPTDPVAGILNWNNETKETASQVLAASHATLPWQKPAAVLFREINKKTPLTPPGL